MKKTLSRFLLTALVLLLMMSALIYKLGTLTLAQGNDLTEQAENRVTRTMAIKGSRGRILDRNGIVLAYSRTSYNVEFLRNADNRSTYDSAVYTESLLKAIEIIERNGGKVIDTSYIRRTETGEFKYEWGVTSEDAIKWRYKNFLEAMGVNIINYLSNNGISVDDDYLASENSANWDVSTWPPAEYLYKILRASWCIPEDVSFEDALKVISIRQEVNLNNYRAYEPIVIAYDVSLETVSEISMRASELVGVQTAQSTTRVYPRGESAAHIVGYLSRSATEEMVKEKGYSYSDYIGASGLEATMEEYLTGATEEHQGERTVIVNKNGSVIREVSYTAPTNGNDVMSTIDIQLQGVVETALEDLIATIRQAEMDRIINPKYSDDYLRSTNGDTSKIHTAQTGAIVVLDVNNGDILAMASYPSFDPNWFIQGLTTEQVEMLFSEEGYAAETTPMRNKAISARLAPGSIFKMVTGIAGLAEGVITLNETIDDNSPYRMTVVDDEGNVSVTTTGMPSCWEKNTAKHQDQDIVKAIQNSCNYYFFEVANRLGIDRLNEWAGMFGLTSSTGVELTGEAIGIIGGQDVLYNSELSLKEQKTSLSGLVYSKLCSLLEELLTYYPTDATKEDVKACALNLMQILSGGSLENTGPQVRRILSDGISIPEGYTAANKRWTNEITSLLTELQWKPALTIRSGIGQGTTLVTPLAVARYVAAVANEGTVYDTHIVDRILDENGALVQEIEPNVHATIEIDGSIWDAIHVGMNHVVSADTPEDTGTAADKFSEEFKNSYLDRISGKTGSAQIGTNTKIDIENTSWFVTYGPRENPEIAVVVCVPYGFSGSSSVPAVEDIFTYYFDKEKSVAPENLVDIGAIVP